VVQFGVKGVMLIGFDMTDKHGQHWYGANNGPGRTNPDEDNFKRWRQAFVQSAVVLDRLGVEVVYASPKGALTCFPKAGVEETLTRWGV
jgi:hypothetical protein